MDNKFKKVKELVDENKKLGSILIKPKEFYLNYHNKKEVESFCYDKEGKLINKEDFENHKEIDEKDIIKKEELDFDLSNINEKNSDIIISKKNGQIEIVTFDLKEQTITRYEVKDKKLKDKVKKVICDVEKAQNVSEIKKLRKLKGYKNFYRLRVWDYRIGLQIKHNCVIFVRILHRKEIYKYFP